MKVGLLRVQGALVALPVDVLREVVPLPERFDALPTAAPGLVGAVLLRETVLPVLDLAALSGTTDGTAPPAAMGVVVLVHDGRALGVLVDSVHDVVTLDPAALQPVAAGDRRLFTAAFVRPGTGEVGSLLDPAAVFGVPGVLAMTSAPDPEGGPPARTGTGTGLDPAHLVVRCTSAGGAGDVLLAIDVADVQTTLPSLSPRPSQLSSTWCLGVTDHGDVRLPVVDPLALLGLPPADRSTSWQALLVRSQRGLLALVFAEALDIVRVAPAARSVAPPSRGLAAAAVRDVARLPQGPAFVLDVAALLADPEVSALTSLNTGPGAAAPTGQVTGGVAGEVTAALHHDPVVLFRARGTVTAPLDQVDGVVPFPATPVPWIGGSSDLGALVTDTDVVPLLDLSELLGRGRLADPTAGVVLLVRPPADDPDGPPRRVGLVVEELSDIERPVWREALDEASAEERAPLVRTGSATGPLLACVDLHGLAEPFVRVSRTATAPSRGPELWHAVTRD